MLSKLRPVMREIRETIWLLNGSDHVVNSRVLYADWLDDNGCFHYRSCVEISAIIDDQKVLDELNRRLEQKWKPECTRLTSDIVNA